MMINSFRLSEIRLTQTCLAGVVSSFRATLFSPDECSTGSFRVKSSNIVCASLVLFLTGADGNSDGCLKVCQGAVLFREGFDELALRIDESSLLDKQVGYAECAYLVCASSRSDILPRPIEHALLEDFERFFCGLVSRVSRRHFGSHDGFCKLSPPPRLQDRGFGFRLRSLVAVENGYANGHAEGDQFVFITQYT